MPRRLVRKLDRSPLQVEDPDSVPGRISRLRHMSRGHGQGSKRPFLLGADVFCQELPFVTSGALRKESEKGSF